MVLTIFSGGEQLSVDQHQDVTTLRTAIGASREASVKETQQLQLRRVSDGIVVEADIFVLFANLNSLLRSRTVFTVALVTWPDNIESSTGDGVLFVPQAIAWIQANHEPE